MAFTAEQPLYNGTTGASVRSAELGRDLATASRGLVGQELGVGVADAYSRVLLAMAARQATAAAIEAAAADRERAGNRRDAGVATEADVLQVDVHLARLREQAIRAQADERIARARLNQMMGEPLDAVFVLDLAPESTSPAAADLAALEAEALRNRAEIRLASLQESLAEAAQAWGAVAVLFTEVSRDGMQSGPAIDETVALQAGLHIDVLASGGVGSLAHLDACAAAGIRGVVLGRALYEGAFTIQEALSRC